MSTVAQEPGAPSVAVIRDELEAVLSSELFVRAPSLAQFLNYICAKSLNGEAAEIKEYSIAVEALGRPAGFDQKEDAIVRVEAHRLRKRLKQYYETAGAGHSVQIVVPPGQYVPQFVPKSAVAVMNIPEPTEAAIAESPANASGERRALAPVIEILPPEPALAAPGHRRLWTGIAIVAVLAVAAALMLARRDPAVTAETGNAGPPTPAAGPDGSVRIACGLLGPNYVDSLGNVWAGDRYAKGGVIASSPQEHILRTRDPVLFRNRREGDFRYDIPLEPGVYELRLYFAERVFGGGNLAGGGETARLFHIFANGAPLIEFLDVIADAGGSNTADVRVFAGISPASDGLLHLQFSSFKEKAFVNAIEINPGVPEGMRPVRIVVGDSSYRDRNGNLWSGDRFSSGGQLVTRPAPEGADLELYRTERFGNFSYAIPAAPGRYTVNLYFTESWFGPGKPAAGGAGSRSFDVYCNGLALLRNFDIYRTAGGPDRPIVKTFHGLTPNAQGKLVLSFVPVENYASLNAIEVIAER